MVTLSNISIGERQILPPIGLNRSSPSIPVAVSEIQNYKQKNLRGALMPLG